MISKKRRHFYFAGPARWSTRSVAHLPIGRRVSNNSKLKCAHILAKRRTKMRTSKFFKKAHKCAHILAKRRTKMCTSKILAKSAQFYFTS